MAKKKTVYREFLDWWAYQVKWHYKNMPVDDQEKIKFMLYTAWNHGRKNGLKRAKEAR